MNSTAALPAILDPAAALAHPNRLRVRRSNAYGLLQNRSDDAEISAAITAADRADLVEALEGALNEQRPADVAAIAAEVSQFVAVVGQLWSRAGREEFLTVVPRDLSAFPGLLVMDALSRARRRLADGRFLLKWVCEDIEPKAEALKIEVENLTRLATLAAAAA